MEDSIKVSRNCITVNEDDLDIYIALELKDILLDLFEKEKKTITFNLSKVERLSTPGIQAIISATKSFKEVNFKGLQPSVAKVLERLEVPI